MLTTFVTSNAARPIGQVLAVEEELAVMLDPELPDLLAVLDLVYVDGEAVHVTDFKTAKCRWNEKKLADGASQLVLYGQMAKGWSGSLVLPVKLHFVVLTKGKKPKVQVLDVTSDPAQVSAVRDEVAVTWTAIKSGNFHPSPTPANCCVCPFVSRCGVKRSSVVSAPVAAGASLPRAAGTP